MKKMIASAAIGVAALAAMPATAATVSIGDGQTFCESLNNSVFGSGDCDKGGNADLSNSSTLSSLNTLDFAGSGAILGYVADAGTTGDGLYPDWAIIELQQSADITFSLVEPDAAFDGTFSFTGIGGTTGTFGAVLAAGGTTSYTFFAAAGKYVFGIDATTPLDADRKNASSYELAISAVPLPAGMVLLMTGLGGLAVMRRKTKA